LEKGGLLNKGAGANTTRSRDITLNSTVEPRLEKSLHFLLINMPLIVEAFEQKKAKNR
jgi:hypothetical protein